MSTTNTSSAPATGNNTATTTGATAATKPKQKLNVHKFPRPPLCERTDRALLIKWGDAVVAETKRGEAYWVLETTHPPSKSQLVVLADEVELKLCRPFACRVPLWLLPKFYYCF